ncbi:MAG: hypothetical protein IOC02_09870 [Methylobacterium sp.]|mgnify:CR=1 FL=1|nr:hypothetical protein [Methylobacterium sp.]
MPLTVLSGVLRRRRFWPEEVPGEAIEVDRCWNRENIFSGSFLNEIKIVAF